MSFKRFDLKVIFIVCIITLTNFVIFWAFDQAHLKLSVFYLLILLIAEVYYLIFIVRKNNMAILSFLKSVNLKEIPTKFSDKHAELSFQELRLALSQISDSYQELKIKKESDFHYFHNIFKSIGIGVFTIKEDAAIDFINQAGLKTLGINALTKLDELEQLKSGLAIDLRNLPNEQQILHELSISNQSFEIIFKANDFKIEGQSIKLISFQNIKSELESRESLAWNKLIRVLNHEIMNSIGPITSLSSSLIDRFEDLEEESAPIESQLKKSSLIALNAIQKRCGSLTNFIESYRELAKQRELKFSSFNLEALLERIQEMSLIPEHLNHSLELVVETADTQLTADEQYVEHMLINLIKNAYEAAEDNQELHIQLKVIRNLENKLLVTVSDNGEGIPEEDLQSIFTPFYTTKQNGNGIGLSLCRQIMNLHGGRIYAESKKGEGSSFTLEF